MNAETFAEAGVKRTIRVVPLGIDPEIFHYRPMPADFPATIRFGCAGRMAHGGVRKGMNEVVEAFKKAFPTETNVRLEVKGFPDCKINPVCDPRIIIHQAYWTDEQLAFWYSTLSCFVSAAKGEGWGMMQHQSLCTGRPLISINWGGVAEFFVPELGDGYALNYELQPAQHAYEGQGMWAVPSECDLILSMQSVFQNFSIPHSMGGTFFDFERISKSAMGFTWENTIERLSKVIGNEMPR